MTPLRSLGLWHFQFCILERCLWTLCFALYQQNPYLKRADVLMPVADSRRRETSDFEGVSRASVVLYSYGVLVVDEIGVGTRFGSNAPILLSTIVEASLSVPITTMAHGKGAS